MSEDLPKSSAKNVILNFLYSGLSSDYNLEILRKILTLNILIFIGSISTATLGTIAFIQGSFSLGVIDFFILSFLLWLFYDLRNAKRYNRSAIMGTVVMSLFFAYLIISGGVENTAYLWLITYPPIAIFLLGGRIGAYVSSLFITFIALVMIFRAQIGIPASYSNSLLIRFFAVYISVHSITYAIERMRFVVQHKMENANTELGELNKENLKLIGELKKTIDEVKTLQGIIPICAHCKKIRNDGGYWEQVEEYVRDHSQAQFSHSICPQCKAELYAELNIEDKDNNKN